MSAQDTEAIRAALGVGGYYAPRIAGLQALGRLVARLEAAEQALKQIASHDVRAPITDTSADDPCDWHCTAQQRDLARAWLAAAAPGETTLAEPEAEADKGATASAVAGSVRTPSGSASAAPGETGQTP